MVKIHKGYLMVGMICVGGLLIIPTSSGVKADDVLAGKTTIEAQVTRGDLIIGIDAKTNFGEQPLNETVDFGSRDIAITIIDYTGSTSGYTITAQLTDADKKRALVVNGVALSETAATVLMKANNQVGENKEKVVAQLKYRNPTETKVYQTVIKWQLTNGTTTEIAE